MMTKVAACLAVWLLALGMPMHALGQIDNSPVKAGDVIQLYAWNGDTPNAAECLRRIAQAKVSLEVDADFAGVESALDDVWVKSTAVAGFEGQADVQVQVALARADLYRRQGDRKRALAAAQQLLLTQADLARLRSYTDKLALVDKKVLIRSAKAEQDSRLVDLRRQLTAEDTQHDSLAAIVRKAYEFEDYNTIAEIGGPAQGAFMDAILTEANSLPSQLSEDPLLYLLRMNERRAAELLLSNLGAGGYIWKRRIVRAMDGVQVLKNEGTWSSEQPYVCLEPEWMSLLEALLSSPETARQCVDLVNEPFLRDQLTPGLQRALIHGIESFDSDFVSAVLQALDSSGVVDSAKPVFEALARHGDPQVRRFGARALTNYASSDALKSLANDPDPQVRISVVRALKPHVGNYVRRYQSGVGSWNVRTFKHEHAVALGESDRALLTQFAKDADVEIRRSTVQALYRLTPPLADEVYLGLMRDTDDTVRSYLLNVTAIRASLRAQLLAHLAQDTSEVVVTAVDDVLADGLLESDPTVYSEALISRLLDQRFPMEEGLFNVVKALVQSPKGIQLVASLMLSQPNRPLQNTFFDVLNSQGSQLLLTLDDATLGAVFARVHVYGYRGGNTYHANTMRAIREARPSRREAMRWVMRNEEFGTAIRLSAAKLAALDGGEAFCKDLTQLLRNEYWKVNAPDENDLDTLVDAVKELPDSDRNAFVLGVVLDKSIPDALATVVARRYSASDALGREVTLAVIQRWFASTGQYVAAVETAIRHLAALPEAIDPEMLRAAALNSHYAAAAVQTMTSLREVEYLPTLERCLEAEWVSNSGERDAVRFKAANGISSYLSDEAAEVLLRGLGSSDVRVRGLCADGLNHIESSRARAKRWEELKAGQPTEESALAELLQMLNDEILEVRVQAIHGIATFGAIEYLPTLIRLLKDPDPQVVNAARVAIRELSAEVTAQRSGDSTK